MKITAIAAMDRNGVIGHEGKLPWHSPTDLKRFKAHTLGKPCVMGRKTYDSLGKPLPGRTNIVLSRGTISEGREPVEWTLEQASGAEELMVIGGAEIYQLFLPYASRILLTVVWGDHVGDTYFPRLAPKFPQSLPLLDSPLWQVTSREVGYRCTFYELLTR